MKRYVSKKSAVIAVVAGLGLSAAGFGLAAAFYSSGGSNTGSASTGFPTTFTVSSPIFVGGPLYPGTGSDTIQATVQNATGDPLALNQLEVSIAGVTMNPPGSLYATAGDPACTTADYALSAPTSGPGSFWTGLTVNGGTKTGQSATWTQNLPQNVGVDDYVVERSARRQRRGPGPSARPDPHHAQQHGEPGRLPGRVRPGDYFGGLIQSSEVVNGLGASVHQRSGRHGRVAGPMVS